MKGWSVESVRWGFGGAVVVGMLEVFLAVDNNPLVLRLKEIDTGLVFVPG